jgi:hypothetical protein
MTFQVSVLTGKLIAVTSSFRSSDTSHIITTARASKGKGFLMTDLITTVK